MGLFTRKQMIKAAFVALIATFLIIVSGSVIWEWLMGPFYLPAIFIFFLLGVALAVLVRKEKGRLSKFLLLTGGSAAGFFVSVFLHNFFYAMGILTADIPLLSSLMGVLDVLFFFVAVIACPLCFLVGTIGSIVLFIKRSQASG